MGRPRRRPKGWPEVRPARSRRVTRETIALAALGIATLALCAVAVQRATSTAIVLDPALWRCASTSESKREVPRSSGGVEYSTEASCQSWVRR